MSNGLEWKFVQSFGDDNSSDDDLVTSVEFDDTGDYLAVGDKAGRICIFERSSKKRRAPLEYKFFTEFQSHEPEFDCLKSLEIEMKINMIKWGKQCNNALFILATNDKTIKFWKVHERKIKRPTRNNDKIKRGGLYVPRLSHYQTIAKSTTKRVFSNAHEYHINSISINSDGESFISADDLRINLWNFEVSDESFNMVDVKPSNLEELTEVITSATFHPTECNTLIYSSSSSCIRLVDMRDSALCDHHSKIFEVEEDPANKSFFSEITTSISDAKFTPDGRYIIARDYLTLKIWDVKMENKPVSVIPIHNYLKMHLCDLYENDCIFDKFECASNSDGTQFLTGSYNNNFMIYDMMTKDAVTVEALEDVPQQKKKAMAVDKNDEVNVNLIDFGKKTFNVDWHPNCNGVAVAGLNKLYIYHAYKNKDKSML